MDSIDIQQLNNNNFTNTQYGKFQRISYIISSRTEPSWIGQTSALFISRDLLFSILVGGNPIDINIDVQVYGQSDPYGPTDSSADISNLSKSLGQGLTIGGQ